MRLIDADALIYHLADYQLQEAPIYGYGNKDSYDAIKECIKAIEEAPTIDAAKAEPDKEEGTTE